MDGKFQEIYPAQNSDHDQGKTTIAAEDNRIDASIENERKSKMPCCVKPMHWFSSPRAYLFGILAAIAIVGIYLTMNTLTADSYFAKVQFGEYRWWIVGLAIGLGTQVTLFTFFRVHLRGKKKTAANSSMATSGGVSTVAMMACCSHYVATVIPLLGISFLSATAVASLEQYQPFFFLAGVVSYLFGIGLMVRMMRKHGMFQIGVPKVKMRLRSGRFSNV
jgi:hypothetical protein